MNIIALNEERDMETSYGYCNEYQPHAVKRMFDHENGLLYDMRWDEAGNLGQVSMGRPGEMFEKGRFLFWTEDCCGPRPCGANRMHAAVDDKYFSYYVYDHSGERRLKLTGDSKLLDVCQRLRTPQNKLNEVSNADLMATYTVLNEPTLYPSAYMVLTNKGYTKHYYAGTERVAARLGGGGLDVIGNDEELQTKADMLFEQSIEQVNSRVLNENNLDCIMGSEFAKEEFGHWIDGIPHQMKAEVKCDHGLFKEMVHSMLDDRNHGHEEEVYFYHSDHLGSASWITDSIGIPIQHLQYLPYGEPYIDQHPFGYSERFRFTGKERDEETGYGYFGARYMDHELMTMWLSVDPMAGKYPSISPYAYCAWNPIRLTDPDGREMNPVYNYKGNLLGCTNEGFTGKIIIYDGENTSFEGMSSDDFVSANYSAEYYDMDNECRLDNVAKESMYRNILSNYDGTDINGYTFYQQDITFNFDKEKSGNYSVNPYLDHFLLNVSEKYLTYQDVIYDGQDAILFRGGHYDASVENIAASIIYHEWYGHYCNKWTEKGGTHYKCYEAVRDCPFFQKCTPEYRDDVLQQIINMK